jgi:hypothetical protein
VLVSSPGQTSHGTYHYVDVEEYEDEGGKKGRKGKKKGRKKNKGSKIMKKMRPLAYGLGGLKLLFDHFLLKKLVFLSVYNFFVGKVAFILASLVALKQFFYTPNVHSRAENQKLEVFAIPVKKHKSKYKDPFLFDESKVSPVTYPNFDELMNTPDTTPAYFTYPHSGFISSEEEAFNDLMNDNNREINAVNDEVDFMKKNQFERSDTLYSGNHNEKSYYLNHVHSPFV